MSGTKALRLNMTRAKFDELSSGFSRKNSCSNVQALKDAGHSASEIDKVILVGGSTRIPPVQEQVKNN